MGETKGEEKPSASPGNTTMDNCVNGEHVASEPIKTKDKMAEDVEEEKTNELEEDLGRQEEEAKEEDVEKQDLKEEEVTDVHVKEEAEKGENVVNTLTDSDAKAENALKEPDTKKLGKQQSTSVGRASAVSKNVNQPETSQARNDSTKDKMKGLIFMCNAQTKNDCFHFKVLGLPASKKDVVAKVYKGMRLFLFDIDLRLLYGIYTAAAPGGYDIEPTAFKSAFPSQVRFRLCDDCLPLPEERFKSVIKDNYYSKNKFESVLNGDQVKNLCKLFQAGLDPGRGGRIGRDEAWRSADRDRKRRRETGRFRVPFSPPGDDWRQTSRLEVYGRDARDTYPSSVIPRSIPYPYDRPLESDYDRRDSHLGIRYRQVADYHRSPQFELELHDELRDLRRDPHSEIHDPNLRDLERNRIALRDYQQMELQREQQLELYNRRLAAQLDVRDPDQLRGVQRGRQLELHDDQPMHLQQRPQDGIGYRDPYKLHGDFLSRPRFSAGLPPGYNPPLY